MTSLLVHNTEAFEAKVEYANSGHVQVCSVCVQACACMGVCVRVCVCVCATGHELALVHAELNDILAICERCVGTMNFIPAVKILL